MSVELQAQRVRYIGNGTAKTFAFPFQIEEPGQVQVVQADAKGTESTLVLNEDYTVALNSGGTGSVTLNAALPTGYVLALVSNIRIDQERAFYNNTPYYQEQIEGALDKLTRICQQLHELDMRHLTVPPTSDRTPQEVMTEIFGTVATANKYAVQAEKTYEATQETKKAVDARAAEVETDRQAVAADRQTVVAVADVVQSFKNEVLDYADEMTTVAENISDITVVRQNVGGIQALAADIQGYPIYEFDGGWLDEPNEPMNGIAGGVLKTNADAIEDIKVVAEAVEGGVFEGLEGSGGVLATLAQNIDTLVLIGEAVKSGTLDQYVTQTEYALGFNGGTL